MKKLIIAGILTGLVSGQAVANGVDHYSDMSPTYHSADLYHAGFYVGAQLGYSKIYGIPSSIFGNKNDGFGFDTYFGYMFNHYLGADMQYTYFAPAKEISNGVKYYPHTLGFYLKGQWPLTHAFAVYAKVGPGIVFPDFNSGTTNRSGKTRVKFSAGAGLEYKFNYHFGANLGWTGVFGGSFSATDYTNNSGTGNKTGNTHLFAAGVTYYF